MPEDNPFYKDSYERLFFSGGTPGLLTNHIHKALEIFPAKMCFNKVLEIGGGEGFHTRFVRHAYSEYVTSDIQVRDLEKFSKDLQDNGVLVQSKQDATNMDFPDETFDRVLSMCVLHHLRDLEEGLKEMRRVCKDDGLVSIYLPCDPGLLYRVMRNLALRKRIKSLGINYNLILARDHQNHFMSILELIKYIFQNDNIQMRKWPLGLQFYDLNIYYIIQIRIRKNV